MKNEPAADRYWKLIYSRISATGESQAKATENVQQMHKATYAEYLAESEAAQAETVAANEAARTSKENRVASRKSRIQSVTQAVAQELERIGNDREDSYARAYANIQRTRPELFSGMDTPAENTARPSDQKARLAAISKGMTEMLNGIPTVDRLTTL